MVRAVLRRAGADDLTPVLIPYAKLVPPVAGERAQVGQHPARLNRSRPRHPRRTCREGAREDEHDGCEAAHRRASRRRSRCQPAGSAGRSPSCRRLAPRGRHGAGRDRLPLEPTTAAPVVDPGGARCRRVARQRAEVAHRAVLPEERVLPGRRTSGADPDDLAAVVDRVAELSCPPSVPRSRILPFSHRTA